MKKRVTRLPVNHDREGYIYSACDRACRRRLNFKSGRYLDVDHFCGKEDDEGVSSRYFRKTVSKGELIVGSEIRLGCASLLEVLTKFVVKLPRRRIERRRLGVFFLRFGDFLTSKSAFYLNFNLFFFFSFYNIFLYLNVYCWFLMYFSVLVELD